MFRLITTFLSVALLSFCALYWSDGNSYPLLNQPIAIVVAISVLVSALSMAFHTFIDGIAKDLPGKTNDPNDGQLGAAIEALSALRQEVIENVMLVLVMLVLYAILSGFRDFFSTSVDMILLDWALLAFQFACLVSIIYGAIVQFLGFRAATKLRDVLARNKGKK